jgi:hypothetical protein
LGFWEFGEERVWVKGGTREGQFTSNLRPRWMIPVTARRVPSKYKGEERGSSKGRLKARGMRHV